MSEAIEIDCPFCAEKIKAQAKKCKHCGEMLDQQSIRNPKVVHSPNATSAVTINSGHKKNFGHFKHLVLALLTAGFWILPWFYFYISRDKNFYH